MPLYDDTRALQGIENIQDVTKRLKKIIEKIGDPVNLTEIEMLNTLNHVKAVLEDIVKPF